MQTITGELSDDNANPSTKLDERDSTGTLSLNVSGWPWVFITLSVGIALDCLRVPRATSKNRSNEGKTRGRNQLQKRGDGAGKA